MKEYWKFLVLMIAALVCVPYTTVDAAEPLIEAQLEIVGNRLSLYGESGFSDAAQVINVGEKPMVRTCYGGSTEQCGTVEAGDSRIAGLLVLAELRGPELPQPIPAQTVPGGTFVLPSFQQEGVQIKGTVLFSLSLEFDLAQDLPPVPID